MVQRHSRRADLQAAPNASVYTGVIQRDFTAAVPTKSVVASNRSSPQASGNAHFKAKK